MYSTSAVSGPSERRSAATSGGSVRPSATWPPRCCSCRMISSVRVSRSRTASWRDCMEAAPR
ncbi:MAG TPA: hypothetical protein VM914_04090, partial [Pyrinomonadaceae bacterium]|nr:hypothetical protein [Pyrinomonadaceae bacterium]